MAIEKVLIVEDDRLMREFLSEVLKRKKIDLMTTDSVRAGIDLIKLHTFDLIITDLKMPEMSGIDVLKAAKEQNCNTVVILITAYATVETAVEAMRLGAFNYLLKPFSPDTLEAMIEKAQEQASLIQENYFLKQEISTQITGKKNQIIAESSFMKQILSDVAKIAKSNSSVFISGESGTGKEVISHAIHTLSERFSGPFIKVNCSAIPEPLIESEFFGHEKGAFTGAIIKRIGRFELADKGTLLLDEISEVPLSVQSKLLRAVQEQEFERVGGTRSIHVDVRLISTSNRNMKEAIEQKIFREDLYYRLNVVPIYLAPLRERKEDILPLAEYFLERFSIENRKARKRLSQEARKKLIDYYWPGNIRELANIIERTIVMTASDLIHNEDLYLENEYPKSKNIKTQAAAVNYEGITLQQIEKKHILDTLASQDYNRTKTAKVLGISIRTLRNKLKLYQY
jgi:two-component system, NtrC family, response regulator AtoC